VSFAPVNTLLEAIEDPQVAAREMILKDARGHRHLGAPIKFTEEPAQPRLNIPKLNEQGDDIRRVLRTKPA
jgi:crotonobetainyl-CoA:carnitine CoA-transferase CaiB-like acyl-CoA transferase